MKICYRNYPVLVKLKNNTFGEMDLSPDDISFFKSDQWAHIYDIWKQNTKHFLNEVNIVSEPFADATEKAKNRLLDSLWLTTLVKSDIYNDHGHFDVKAYGEELNDHHLKWIREDKSEYIAPARILKYFKINGG